MLFTALEASDVESNIIDTARIRNVLQDEGQTVDRNR